MKTESIIIEWKDAENLADTLYYVNGSPVGRGNAGFDAVLTWVRRHPTAAVVVRFHKLPLGSQDPNDALPFKARLRELEAAIRPRTIAFDFR